MGPQLAEFNVGPNCLPQDIVDDLAEQFGAVVPLPGEGKRALGVCDRRDDLGTSVVALGVWGDPDGFTDDQLRAVLANADLLTAGCGPSTRGIWRSRAPASSHGPADTELAGAADRLGSAGDADQSLARAGTRPAPGGVRL